MPYTTHVSSCSAIVNPPAALMDCIPIAPSDPMPVRRTETNRVPTASEKNGGMCCATAIGGMEAGRLGRTKRSASTPPVEDPITIIRRSFPADGACGDGEGLEAVCGVVGDFGTVVPKAAGKGVLDGGVCCGEGLAGRGAAGCNG